MEQVEQRLLQNKYEIISKIKQGGFGIVYYGFDRVFDKPVAIKAVDPAFLKNSEYINLFLNEAKNAAKLSHNNIVHIYDLVKDESSNYFIIMEFVEGFDLGRILSQCKKKRISLPIELSVYIIKEICKALEYAHNKRNPITNQPLKLVHHDISPSNLMVSIEGHVKLIDFGLAKLRVQKKKTGEIVISGKLPYLTPEQISGGQIDRRMDIYSLGVVFYEMLTGTRLVDSKETKEAIQQITKGLLDPTKLDQKNVPPPIQEVLLKMLQKDPEQRYFGANGVYVDMVEFLMANTYSIELSTELGKCIQELYNKKAQWKQTEVSIADPEEHDSEEFDDGIEFNEIIINESFFDSNSKLENQTDVKEKSAIESKNEKDVPQKFDLSNNSTQSMADTYQNVELENILLEFENDFKLENGKNNIVSTDRTTTISNKKNNSESPAYSEKVNPEKHLTISNIFHEDEEAEDDLKTVFDVFRLSTKSHKKGIIFASSFLLSLLLLFLVFDFAQHLTPIGGLLHNIIKPPTIKIITIPSGATVYLNEKRIAGETPVSIPEIDPGVYQLSLTHAGFNPLTKSIRVFGKDNFNISGENNSSNQQSFLFMFKSKIDLNSNPTGATIFLNNVQYPQKTPAHFDWEEGVLLSIELTYDGLNKISGLSLNTRDDEIDIDENQQWSFEIFNSPVKKYSIEATFEKSYTLNIIPNNVEWFINGSQAPVGSTSLSNTFSLPVGEHEILFKKQGFNDKLITLKTDENSPEIISLVMDRTVYFSARQNTSGETNEIYAQLTKYVFNNKTYALNKVTPCKVTLPAVDVTVYVEKEGYKETKLIVPAKKRQVAFTLEASVVIVEVSVLDALTDIPLDNTNITYQLTSNDFAEDILFGVTGNDGKCVGSLKSGAYNFRANKDGYFEKQLIFNSYNTDSRKVEFKLIIQ
jgi:serine/threonine protein kinase